MIPALICSGLESKHPILTLSELDTLLRIEVYLHYKSWCRTHARKYTATSFRFNGKRFSKLGWADFPELSSHYKAAVVKTMMFWASDYMKDQDQEGNVPNSRLRWLCMHSFAKFQYFIDEGGPFFGDQEVTLVTRYGHAALLFYQELAGQDRARTDGRRFLKITPKFHSLLEMLLYVKKQDAIQGLEIERTRPNCS